MQPSTLTFLLSLAASLSIAANNPARTTDAVLWRDPAGIQSRNLFYGPGGENDRPTGTFTFVSEDSAGTNPKIVVRDENSVKWTVKLGPEAKPETAATRLIWAVGYFANEDFFVPRLNVTGMPLRLHRGQNLLAPDGSLPNVRLKRHLEGEKKSENWRWRQNDFTGTRELNGLRVIMALFNDWDLTDENNAVYTLDGERIFMVSDLGSTFGSGNLTWPARNARGNLQAYRHSKFITKVTPDYVDFHSPARDSLLFLATPREYFSKLPLHWIGKRIPRDDAKWIAQLLARLSPAQIRDAFRSAGFSPQEVEGFAQALQARIAQLEEL